MHLMRRKPMFPLMTANVKLCRTIGLWYDETHWRFTWQTVIVIASQVLWYMIPTVAFMIRKEKIFTVQLKPILEIVEIGMIVVRTGSHWINRKTLTECFSDLQETLDQFSGSAHEDVRSTLNHLQCSADRLVKIYVCIVLFQAISYGPLEIFLTIVGYVRGDPTLALNSPVLEADYVFFDHLSSFSVWLLSSITSVVVQFLMVITITANECLLWNLLHHVSCLFRITRYEISRLSTFKDDHNMFKEQLATIVKMHEIAFRCARRLENVLSPVLGLLYCSCVFQTCYVLFVASVVDNPVVMMSMIFILQYTVFLIFSFSMLGTELIEESASICDAIYSTSWYEWSVDQKRLILFMHLRFGRATGITAAKFFFLTRSTFRMAMRNALSLYTIIQQLYED